MSSAQSFLNLLWSIPISILPKGSNISKRSVLLVTSVGGLFALLVTAVYMKRKRKSLPSINPDPEADKNGNFVTHVRAGKRRKRPKSRRLDLGFLNAAGSGRSSRVQCRSRRVRDNSVMSESSTISSVKSSTSRHSRHLPVPGTKEYYDAERLYRKGVDAFESAVLQWERASAVFGSEVSDVSSTQSGRSSSLSHEHKKNAISESNHSSNTPITRSRKTSMSRTTIEGSSVPGCDDIIPDSGAAGDQIIINNDQLQMSSPSEIEQKIALIMERADKLQRTFEDVLYSDSETESDTDITLTGYDDHRLFEIDSDSASFVSAQEVWETRSLDDYPVTQHLALYEAALEYVDMGRVRCRTMRSDLLECFSDVEFLAKLHCVRQALDLMLEDVTVRDWLIESGRLMIELILKSANQNVTPFVDAFSKLIEYVKDSENWPQIEDELNSRKVVSMTFYDIVLDFIIMDSFDDLDRPPSQLLTILGNRWLGNSIKESALSTAVWSVLKAKSRMLRYQDGFIAKFYAVSESVSPTFAWGFLGTDEQLKSNCEKFKSEILSFLRAMFSFDKVRYTTKQQMADDILNLARYKVTKLVAYFETQQR
ncbi:mitoguardin 2-like isoform X2 [Styela clava]|uniref:mitoguardin 2-like isoform X2 n=1 Tax=Styela clava TaxID=7725 RepID=UPI00193A0DAA|nr:mitoguardin 2-like isoform X2 [Styela clava]